MIFRHERGGVSWVDLELPTAEELRAVSQEFNVSTRIENELATPSPLPISSSESNAALLVLHFPNHSENEEEIGAEQEINIVLGTNFLLTVRYEVVDALHTLHKSLEARELVGVVPPLSADEFLELVLGKIFDSVRDHTKSIAARLGRIEQEMFSGRERETVRSISSINREFLHLEAALADDEDPLTHFLEALGRRHFFGPHFAERSARILAERDHLARLISTHRAVATELQETNAALLNSTQNEIMKRLTVISFIFLPLTLVASLFQMEVLGRPLATNPDGFWIVIGIMLVVSGIAALFVTRKRWF